MPIKQIQVKRIISKETHTIIVSSTEEMYNIFSDDLKKRIKEGMLIEAIFEVREKEGKTFSNILSFDVLGEKDPSNNESPLGVETPAPPPNVAGVPNQIIKQKQEIMKLCKEYIELLFETTIKDSPDIIPCISTLYISINNELK